MMKSFGFGFVISLFIAASARAQSESSALCRDAHGRICRSEAAKHSFEKLHPLPAGAVRHNYVIDHIVPLACGGKDAPINMQWQSIAEGHKKDRWELNCKLAKDSARVHARITRDSLTKLRTR